MNRTKVNSSVVAAIGYEAKSETLEVEIITGEIYHYLNVPSSDFFNFLNADSKGRYYNQVIKKKFNYRRGAA